MIRQSVSMAAPLETFNLDQTHLSEKYKDVEYAIILSALFYDAYA